MNEYELSNEITVITNATRDMLLDKNIDALVLYLFYTKGTNHQKSNSIWITDEFAMKGLKWGRDRVVRAKNFLIDNNLIELKKQRFENGTYGKTFVVVKYLWKQENKDLLIERDCIQLYQNPQVVTTEGGFQETNALSNYKLNALSNKNKMLKVSKKKNNSEEKTEHIEILNYYNMLFSSNRPSKDKSWCENADYWLQTYTLDEIKLAIKNWHTYPHWSKKDGKINGLTFLFRRFNTAREKVNYIDEMLKLDMKPKQKHPDAVAFDLEWESYGN